MVQNRPNTHSNRPVTQPRNKRRSKNDGTDHDGTRHSWLSIGFQHPCLGDLSQRSSYSAGYSRRGVANYSYIGGKFYRIRPIHSLTSQLASTSVILAASLFGGPVSTTHVVSSAILGVGAGQRKSQVRWGVMKEILLAWFLNCSHHSRSRCPPLLSN